MYQSLVGSGYGWLFCILRNDFTQSFYLCLRFNQKCMYWQHSRFQQTLSVTATASPKLQLFFKHVLYKKQRKHFTLSAEVLRVGSAFGRCWLIVWWVWGMSVSCQPNGVCLPRSYIKWSHHKVPVHWSGVLITAKDIGTDQRSAIYILYLRCRFTDWTEKHKYRSLYYAWRPGCVSHSSHGSLWFFPSGESSNC